MDPGRLEFMPSLTQLPRWSDPNLFHDFHWKASGIAS